MPSGRGTAPTIRSTRTVTSMNGMAAVTTAARPARRARVGRGCHGMPWRGTACPSDSHVPASRSRAWLARVRCRSTTVKPRSSSAASRLPTGTKCWCWGWNHGHQYAAEHRGRAGTRGRAPRSSGGRRAASTVRRRVELGPRLAGVLQVVVHADHVVGAGQVGRELGEQARGSACVDPAPALGLLDRRRSCRGRRSGRRASARGRRGRSGRGRCRRRASAWARRWPATIVGPRRWYESRPAWRTPISACSLAEAVVEVVVVEVEALEREARVLEDVAAVARTRRGGRCPACAGAGRVSSTAGERVAEPHHGQVVAAGLEEALHARRRAGGVRRGRRVLVGLRHVLGAGRLPTGGGR